MTCNALGKETFDLLLNSLKENRSAHLYIIWTTMSLQLGAIGWLVTSENARAYLAKNKKIIWFLLTAIGFLVFAHISMIIDGFKVSEELVKAIEKNSFYSECINKEEKIFELYKLKSSSVLLRGIFTTTLFGVLAFFIVSVREDFKKT